ncbi:MAG: hypothetical protein ACRCRR_05430, partial [Rickettsia sp.]
MSNIVDKFKSMFSKISVIYQELKGERSVEVDKNKKTYIIYDGNDDLAKDYYSSKSFQLRKKGYDVIEFPCKNEEELEYNWSKIENGASKVIMCFHGSCKDFEISSSSKGLPGTLIHADELSLFLEPKKIDSLTFFSCNGGKIDVENNFPREISKIPGMEINEIKAWNDVIYSNAHVAVKSSNTKLASFTESREQEAIKKDHSARNNPKKIKKLVPADPEKYYYHKGNDGR